MDNEIKPDAAKTMRRDHHNNEQIRQSNTVIWLRSQTDKHKRIRRGPEETGNTKRHRKRCLTQKKQTKGRHTQQKISTRKAAYRNQTNTNTKNRQRAAATQI